MRECTRLDSDGRGHPVGDGVVVESSCDLAAVGRNDRVSIHSLSIASVID